MPPRANPSESSDIWVDPLFGHLVSEFDRSVKRLRRRSDEDLEIAKELCESSRSILFQNPRLRVSEAEKLIELFKAAVDRIRLLEFKAVDDQELAVAYADHIQKRVDMLTDQVKGAERSEVTRNETESERLLRSRH